MTDKVIKTFWRTDAAARALHASSISESWLSPLLLKLYRARRLRGFCLRLCKRLEGGAMFSATLRRLLRDFHGIEVGRFSYGDILTPGVLPRGTRVGDWCSVGKELIVRRRNHPVERPIMHAIFYNSRLGFLTQDSIPVSSANPLSIGHDVWIGDRVTVLSGCRNIGNGAVIAAGSVVTRDVPPYCIVGGVPARLLRMRFAEGRIAEIEASRWWERDLASIISDPPFPGIFG
jgi:virginiamycin A acetyltransferase